MTQEAKLVLRGYFALSEAEKREVEDAIDQYRRAGSTEKKASIRKTFGSQGRITMGPVSTGCPCCGR